MTLATYETELLADLNRKKIALFFSSISDAERRIQRIRRERRGINLDREQEKLVKAMVRSFGKMSFAARRQFFAEIDETYGITIRYRLRLVGQSITVKEKEASHAR